MTVAMVLDGVIRRDRTSGQMIRQGLRVYHSLAATGNLVIFCGADVDRADWFLRANGLSQHGMLIPEDIAASPTPEGRRMSQVRRLRATGATLDFVVEPDPDIAAELFREGIPVMAYLHPSYSLPSFRPDYRGESTPWKTLTEEVDYQLEMRANHSYIDSDPLNG